MSSPLKQNTITIQELLNTIDALPEAGGGESGSGSGDSGENVETCTVTFDNESLSNDSPPLFIVAIVYENNIRKNFIYTAPNWSMTRDTTTLVSIPNVVCGTQIFLIVRIAMYATSGEFVEIDGSATYDSISEIETNHDTTLLTFTAPATAGENCTIYYAMNP